jgi:hypothetical protein
MRGIPCTTRAVTLPIATALASILPTLSAQTTPTSLPDLHAVHYGTDLSQRDALIATGGFYGDFGAWGAVRLDPVDVSRLRQEGFEVEALGTVSSDRYLVYVARARNGIGPIHGRPLLARRPFFLCEATEAQLPESCRGSGFHGGVQAIALDRPYAAPRVSTAHVPGMQSANGPGMAPLIAQLSGGSTPFADPLTVAMVAQVQQSNLQSHVNTLAAIFTRRASQPGYQQAVTYVQQQLAAIPNLTVTLDTFATNFGPNVIAELPGGDLANEIVMVGAHLDSITTIGQNPTTRAPGADDNASGSAAVLELARIMSQQNFRRTIRFAWWGAEEFGLVGSDAYSAAAQSAGEQIVAYVNTDMNAYAAPGDGQRMTFITNDSTVSLTNALVQSAQVYVPGLTVTVGPLSGGTSDHRAFFQNGFAAAFPFEDDQQFSPFIHSTQDDVGISANDFNQSRLITQAILGGLADLAEPFNTVVGTFDVIGTACTGTATGPQFCATINENGGTLTDQTRQNEYAYRVPNSGFVAVQSFDLYTASGTGQTEAVSAYIYGDAGGQPETFASAVTTMVVGPTPGFYTAQFAFPAGFNGDFYVAIDHRFDRAYVSQLTSGAGGSAFFRGTPSSGAWSPSQLITRPSLRVQCSGSGAPTQPVIGCGPVIPRIGSTYDITLASAPSNTPAAMFTGFSDQTWIETGIPLPFALPGMGSCTFQVSLDLTDSRLTDGAGKTSAPLTIPNAPILTGLQLYHQWLVLDPGANPLGLTTSASARATIGD